MRMLIGGRKADAQDGKVIEIFNPATNELVDTVPSATKEDLEQVLNFAQQGKRIWATTPLHERSRILMNYADLVAKHQEELAFLLCRETGKTIRNARTEIDKIPHIFRGFVEKANHLYGLTIPDSFPGTENDLIFTRREPLGVVLCVLPFNFPAVIFAYKVASALAVGNAVIVKPPFDNPLTNMRLTELLLESGVPGSVAQIVTGDGPLVGKYLTTSSKIEAISFTGSTPVGIEILKEAAPHLHRVFLGLRGNDALIIAEDADLELSVAEALTARITNAGQICIAAKRLVVHNSVKDVFAKLLIEKLNKLRIGDPLDPQTDLGCLINENAAREVENQVKHTIKQGASCVYGGKRFQRTFFEPTVLVDVTPEMDIAKDMEVFGPVFPIIGFQTLEEAINICNSSVYGLNSGVITRDLSKAMKVAMALECGGIIINGSGNYRLPEMAFGGYKMSGLGREGISCTLEALTQVKTIVLKKVLK